MYYLRLIYLSIKVRVASFEQGLVYQLEDRSSADPQYIAIAVSQTCRFSHQPNVKPKAQSHHQQKSTVDNPLTVAIETLTAQQKLVVYLSFADTAQAAIDMASELLSENAEHQHIQASYDMLTQSYLWTSDNHYNKALMWSKAAGRCFVSQQIRRGYLGWFTFGFKIVGGAILSLPYQALAW